MNNKIQRDWSEAGKQYYTSSPGKVAPITREQIEQEIPKMDWKPVPENQRMKMPPNQAIALVTFVKEMKLPKLSDIAISKALAPYGFYAIRTHYNNGQVELYLIDDGLMITILCVDMHPMELDKEDLIKCWISIGKEICPDVEINRMFFYECLTLAIMESKLQQRTWYQGQAFFYKNICFLNTVEQDAVWHVIRDGIHFATWGYPVPEVAVAAGFNFIPAIEKILEMSLEQLRATKDITYV